VAGAAVAAFAPKAFLAPRSGAGRAIVVQRLTRTARPERSASEPRIAQSARDGASSARAVVLAWHAEMDAFYEASKLDEPFYGPLGLGVVAGGPEDEQMTAYLAAQAASRVVGPSTWRIGDIELASLNRHVAVVQACSYDPGSHLRSSGMSAPRSLGGGAGFSAYRTSMAFQEGMWKLAKSVTWAQGASSRAGPCRAFISRVYPALLVAARPRVLANAQLSSDSGGNGGGAGSTGSSIWSWVWWTGSPTGPGPYTGSAQGGADLCVWHDVGSSLSDLDSALVDAALPSSFWTVPLSGGHPGIWAVNLWGAALAKTASAADHFDLVACPSETEVPVNGGDVESDLPPTSSTAGKAMYLWIFWDTVPDPAAGDLPAVIGTALARAKLPSPVIDTSPSSVDEFADATIVNFPTWLWVSQSQWRTVIATASGGNLVATVWATPLQVTWRSQWTLSDPHDDPQGGVTVGTEDLDLSCAGPGTQYDRLLSASAQTTTCKTTFSQSTFGTYQHLVAEITWQVEWALSNDSGVVGGEGSLATSVTSSVRPLRVLQVESVITQG